MNHSSIVASVAAAVGVLLQILHRKTEDRRCLAAGFEQRKSFAVDFVPIDGVDGNKA